MPRIDFARRIALLLIVGVFAFAAQARQGEPPYSLAHRAKVSIDLPIEDAPAIDAARQRAADDSRLRGPGPHTKRLRVALANPVAFGPDRNGVLDTLADGSRLWRIRVRAPGATDLRLGFGRYALPAGATLHVIGADDYYQGPYTAADATDASFHAPVVPGDTATVELHVPAGAALSNDTLELTGIGAGFRDVFGRRKDGTTGPGASGACNIDVVCPLGAPYPDEIRAVGHYEFQADDDQQYYICTGTLLADVARDGRNYFLTAAHCLASRTEAASIVVYWNFQSTQCGRLGEPAGGYYNDDQHGAALRATRADVDFTLLELSQAPDAAWNVYRAGWDASGRAPSGTIGIHHPSGDVKKITTGPAPVATPSCIAPGPVNTHWWTGPYTQGTTEGGSSGSGLFAAAADGTHARLLIGTLSGGDAACSSLSPTRPNDGNDCYGQLAVAWNGTGPDSRLRDWLDPANTGTLLLRGGDGATPIPVRGHSRHPIPALLQRNVPHPPR